MGHTRNDSGSLRGQGCRCGAGLRTGGVERGARLVNATTLLKLIPGQPPWWLGGPGMGLCVLALYGLANCRLGVFGAWLAGVVAPIEGWRGEHWRVEFLIALIAGALTAGVLGSATRLTERGTTLRRLAQEEASHATAG